METKTLYVTEKKRTRSVVGLRAELAGSSGKAWKKDCFFRADAVK